MACPMNLIPTNYTRFYLSVFDRRYTTERRRLQNRMKVNAITNYDYKGAIKDFETKESAPLTRYKELVLKWLRSELEVENDNVYFLRENEHRRIIYVDNPNKSYFTNSEYNSLFNNLMQTKIRKKIQVSSEGDIHFKPKQLSAHHNKLIHNFGKVVNCNSLILEIRSMYYSEDEDKENEVYNYGKIHYYVSQNPFKCASSGFEEKYEGNERPWYLLHIEDYCDLSDEGLPREYFAPRDMNLKIMHQWVTQLTNSSMKSWVKMCYPQGWAAVSLQQNRFKDGASHVQKCMNIINFCDRQPTYCQNNVYFPEGHSLSKCKVCKKT